MPTTKSPSGVDQFKTIVTRTKRVPAFAILTSGTNQLVGAAITRQLDCALISIGFKLSGDLFTYLASQRTEDVVGMSAQLLTIAQEMVGDHVKHNVYFKNFPENVPDTKEFWMACLVDARLNQKGLGVQDIRSYEALFAGHTAKFPVGYQEYVNLLSLPGYGRYLHSYEEMVANQEEFIPDSVRKLTVLHLGGSLLEESVTLYHMLAGSKVPLSDGDRALLKDVAQLCLYEEQPVSIPIRENRAIINKARIENNQSILVDTVIDVLRLACIISGGDETLEKPTKFKSMSRPIRRNLMRALDEVVQNAEWKLADVNKHAEVWKRLGERVHPHEFKGPGRDVFAVARGDKKAASLAGKVELALSKKDVFGAIDLLATAPGMLFRNLDRLLVVASDVESGPHEGMPTGYLLLKVRDVIEKVSGRVILSVREHLQNRIVAGTVRIFTNSKGKAWVEAEDRQPLSQDTVEAFNRIFDAEILRRLPDVTSLFVETAALGIALPLSEKNKSDGFGILPRGSVMPVPRGLLRFFVYWKEATERTDYDLSVFTLDKSFQALSQCSWTDLRGGFGGFMTHSGDITSAPNGASEFIDVDLEKADCQYIVPQVNVFSGNSYDEAEEACFGFMERTKEQKGKPFEASTVRVKSDLRGKGQIALPLVFMRNDRGEWVGKWLHLYMKGMANFNRVEQNRVSAGLLAKAMVDRKYLTVQYLVDLLSQRPASKSKDVYSVYIGLQKPTVDTVFTKVYSIDNLLELIPA